MKVTKTRNKLKIMGLVLALLLVLGVMPLLSIRADAAYTTWMAPFNLTATVTCRCGKDAGVAGTERVSYSQNGATTTYDIKVEWWCSTCYKNYNYTWYGISVTCDDCEKGTSVTVTKNLSTGAKINFNFWRDAGEHSSYSITTTPATCISTGEKRVDNCYNCGLTKTLETYPIDPDNHSSVNGFCELCGDKTHVCNGYDNGFCTDYGCYEPAVDSNSDGVYEISSAGQLYWFAEQVNNGETAINVILMNDIVINSQVLDADGNLISDTSALRQWTPIGQYNSDTDNLGFTGIFDGNGKTIRGLYHYGETARYAGLFGYSSGMVQGLTIADSYIHTNHSEGRAGSIVGRNHGTVSNCHNFGSVNGYMQIGGIAGWNSGTVEKCSNYGTVKGYYIVGGIAGVASDGTINDCYNLGSVEADNGVGGIVGWTQNTSNVSNCISIGTVEGSKDAGGVVGLVINNSASNITITNCYHDNTVCSYDPAGRNLYIATATSVEGKTTEQFASGEVAYLLGEHFGQTLEGENRQSYPVLGGAKIYYGYISCANGAVKVYTNDSTASDTKPKHTGGTATCQSQAVCVACGASYGDLNPDNHISVDIEMGLCSCGYQFEARIGDTPYVTFEAAFLAASTGDTVVAYAGRSGGNLVIPKGVIFNGGEYEFSTMTENRGEIIGGKYTGNTINYGKITGGLFEGNRFVVSNYGEITGGTFNIYVEHYSGKLTGGIFNIFVAAHANIDGGHFTESSGIDFYADMDTGIFYVVINGGVFDCDFTAFTNIYGGEFNGEVINCSEIFGGVFNGEVINRSGKIFDGEFNGKVTNGVLAENGMLDRNGFILGGIFNSEILNNSHIYNLVDDDYTFILGESFVMTYVNGRITCEEHIKASDATCTAQAICRICGSYGELLDHSWTDATCETPKTCSVCNLTEGEALGHDYADATCETPKTCKICNATEGEALGHDYADATCETPKTCKICNATEGEALGHDFADATTEAPKTCKNCGATEGEPLSKPEEPNWLMKIINAILDFLKKLFVIK